MLRFNFYKRNPDFWQNTNSSVEAEIDHVVHSYCHILTVSSATLVWSFPFYRWGIRGMEESVPFLASDHSLYMVELGFQSGLCGSSVQLWELCLAAAGSI